MTWTALPLTATCDLADPGWTNAEAPTSACDLAASETLVFHERAHVLDTGYEGSLLGWTLASMESACDG